MYQALPKQRVNQNQPRFGMILRIMNYKISLINGEITSIGWSADGMGNYEYNVVAIYNYDGTQPPLPNHITYVFAFHDGQPVALVDQSRDGGPRLTETQNNEVKSNFAEIAE